MSTYDVNVCVEAVIEARHSLPNGTSEEHRVVDIVAHTLADRLANDNPHFDRDEFFRITATIPALKQ